MKLSRRNASAFLLAAIVGGSSLLIAHAAGATRAEKRNEIQSELKNAATAEESYRTTDDSYTRVLNDLRANGFDPNPRINLLIPRGGGEGYCLEAQHRGLGEIWHYSSSVGRPERGRC